MADTSVKSLLGGYVVDHSGNLIDWSSISGEGKIIGLYFSAHWCPPCRGFTPVLAEYYNGFKASPKGQQLEIIFISSDSDEASFKDYYGSMPWLSMSYEKRAEKELLSKKFKVQGIPTLIILNGATEEVITSKGREKVVSDPDGFPWPVQSLPEILYSGNFIRHDGTEVPATDFRQKIKAVYFSAHWCPPCRMFTPTLITLYQKLKEQGKEFEIIFASSDRDDDSFKEYFGSMPWLAIPLGDKRKEKLSDLFDVDGIPTLVILDQDDNTITRDGRSAVGGDPEGVDFPWHPKPVNELTDDTVSSANEQPCLVYFTDGSAEAMDQAKLHLQEAAEKYFCKNRDEQKLLFFYTGDADVVDSLRSFAKIPETVPFLAIIDIPNQEVVEFSGTEVNKAAVDQLSADFIAGKCTGRPLR